MNRWNWRQCQRADSLPAIKNVPAFEESTGIKFSGDASVAIFERGISAEVDTQNLKRDVVAFIFEEFGACAGANLEGNTFEKVEIVEQPAMGLAYLPGET
jgi:lipid-binding SYLF domain-containing protein